MTRILGIAGWSGAGKTTLIEAMLPVLTGAGLTVSTIKHTHHGFDLDQPGKDSFRHRTAGAREVMLVGDRRFALTHEFGGNMLSVEALVARLEPVDLVLIEGFRDHPIPKLEVYRPSLGKPRMFAKDPGIIAVAADAAVADCNLPLFDLNLPAQIAHWIIDVPL